MRVIMRYDDPKDALRVRPGGHMRVLVVEDEKKTAEYVKKGLTEHGFVVDVAENGEEGLYFATTGEYAVIVLDVMMPDKDGWTVVSELRKSGNQTPVLFLTAKDTLDDKVRGLELGADDYMVKPFAFAELLTRIRTVLRRGPERRPHSIRIADLEIDFFRRKVTRAGKRIDLSPKEFATLWALASRQGEVMSRTLISEQVWDVNLDSDANIVDVVIRRLRKKVDEPFGTSLIHTLRGVGYVLEDRSGTGW
jgi:two-component system, OmpR family, copper resistance phosphate regulon response regulator CusR